MLLKMLKSKIHRARVTETRLHYPGSILIDSALMKATGILPYEGVLIADLTNGSRVETYAVPAPANSGQIIVLGAAAKLMKKNDCSKLVEPDPDMGTAENFLYMLNGKVPDRLSAELFDTMLIFHAEHGGGNNSTFTTRCVSSSGANTYMAICAGIGSLSGHLHGGANEAVVRMVRDIKRKVKDWDDDEEIKSYLKMLLEKTAGDKSGKIYGLGHAVYTLSDPRAVFLEKRGEELAKLAGRVKEFQLYKKIAKLAPQIVKDKKGKVVCTNVDFYSGFVYQCMGIPEELFTPIFAMARVSGWSAHRIEEIIQGRIIRPSYFSSLKGMHTYTPLSKR